MALKDNLQQIFNSDYPGTDAFINEVIVPVFGEDIDRKSIDFADKEEYQEKASKAGLKKIVYAADINDEEYRANNIAFFDVTVGDNVNVERARVNIQQVIRSIVDRHSHILIVFHYENVEDKPWRFSYAFKQGTIASTTSAKRYTYVFGRDFRGRTAADRFAFFKKSDHSNNALEEAFSVEALSQEFFDKYRDIYSDFVQYITGKRYEKIKNKWKEVRKEDPNTEIFSQFNNDDKKVRDYIKKMMGRLTFLCFLQRKGWMNSDRNFLHNLYQTSPKQDDFLDAVLEPLFFGVLNTPSEKRKEVFTKNGWNIDLADEWKGIPYLNGGLFEQTREDKLTVKFPKRLFHELFKFLGEYNFTIDENDPDDAEIGIDPEMLGRVFESLLEDNKDKGAFYTPKVIVQYMCRQSIIEYLKTHTDKSLHIDIEDLINKGLVNHALQNKDNARNLYRFLKEVTVCDPAIGSGAFPMGILNILFTARQHIYGFLKETEPFNPLEIKKNIIRDNIYGVDIEQGAVDIARLRFWLAILVEEQFATPLPNLDYRIVRGNSLITTFNDEFIQLPENPDGRTKLAKLKKELHQLQKELFDLNGDEKLQREIEIKCKILEIIRVQLGIDKANAQAEGRIESNIFEDKKLSGKALKKAMQARSIEEVKSKSLFALNNLITSLTTPATSLADRAQIDIKFFDWKIIFSNIFSDDTNSYGFDIVIGNPPYGVSIRDTYRTNIVHNYGQVPDYEIYYYFIEVANNLLHNNGVLSYIIPNSYLFNFYATNYRLHLLKDWAIIEILDCTKFQIFKSAVVRNTINLWRKKKNHNQIGYRNTAGVNSFDDLIAKVKLSIDINDLIKMNQNWALAFSLTPEKTKIINKISSVDKTISKLFPEISQGLIAYDKYRGQSQEIIQNRSYHYSTYHTGLKQWLWGEDVQRFRIQWNGKEYIDYCDGIANPRNPKFFKGKRILIREITNPSIFAALTDKELYHDPALIVVKDNNLVALEVILGILNSKMATFFHFHHSPKATKGAFPKILIQDIKDFPIPEIPKRIEKIITTKVTNIIQQNCTDPQSDTSAIEKDIDIIVYNLYDLTYDEVLIIDPEISITREEYENFNI